MFRRVLALLLSLALALSLTACQEAVDVAVEVAPVIIDAVIENMEESEDFSELEEPEEGLPAEEIEDGEQSYVPERDGWYYDVENVVLYLDTYGELPENFITKNDANELGWSGGSVEKYKDGAAIGGDTFGNREGLLPKADGRKYTECDIDTDGKSSRGAERLVFSNDGLYFYTDDHYESFSEIYVTEEKEVEWK